MGVKKYLPLFWIVFLIAITKKNFSQEEAFNPQLHMLEIYIHSYITGSGNVTWFNTAASTTYHPDQFYVTNNHLVDSLSIPRYYTGYAIGYDFNNAPSGDEWTHLDAGIYKIMLTYESGGIRFSPYFFFDYRDEDWNKDLPGYGSPDIVLEFFDTNNDTFIMYPFNNPINKTYIKSGCLVTHWNIHNNAPPKQEDYQAADSFNLNIVWHISGHPYLYWNQTTPQGTNYHIYRNIGGGRFNWELISGPVKQLFFIDTEISWTNNNNQNIYYYIKTSQNKASNTKSLLGEYTPFYRQKKVIVKDLEVNPEFKIAPNPFNSAALLSIPSFGNQPITIKIRDLTGRLVKTLAQSEILPNNLYFYAGDLASGIYFCQLIAGQRSHYLKFAVVR